ncbi:MAG: phasin family protein [Armatimonadota bacterium]
MTDGAKDRTTSWGDLLTQAMELGLGAASLTVETAQKVVNELVSRGQVSKDESAGLVDRLIAMGREQRETMTKTVEQATERAMIRMDLARRSDLEALRKRVSELEEAVLGHSKVSEPITPIMPEDLNDE